MHKVDDIGPFLLRDTVSLCYNDSSSSFEIIKFVRDNLAKLCYNSSLLEKYFPSLLKVRNTFYLQIYSSSSLQLH